MIKVIFEKVSPRAQLPTKGSEEAACFDLYASHDAIIEFGKTTIIDTGLRVQIPKGYEIVVRPRSGLAFKHGLTIINSPGTIDSDYRGNIQVIMTSTSIIHKYERFEINQGDRIAQIKLQEVVSWEPVIGTVEDNTKRSVGGFGSTGI